VHLAVRPAVAPKPEDIPKLLQAMGDLMREQYDYSAM